MEKWKKIGEYTTGLDIEARGNKRRLVDSNGKVLYEYVSKSESEEISE